MALLVKKAIEGYSYALNEGADPRTNGWFLVKSPITIAFIITVYLLFVLKIGPSYMKNRQPFNIDRLLIAYNVVQVIFCTCICLKILPWLVTEATFFCNEVDYTEKSTFIAEGGHMFFLSKVLDLLDTVFFVLRKKTNQVSFLHVYHHTLMVVFCWYTVKYFVGGQLVFIGIINSFVHIVMYSYYLLTAYNSEYKKSVWWKKHITQLQLMQFFLVFLLLLFPLFASNCNFPKAFAIIILPQDLAITCLFADFYYKTYIKSKPAVIESK